MTPEQEIKLNEVHAAIVGNPAMGQKGIVPRLKDIEEYQEQDRRFKSKVAGGIFVGTPVLMAVWEYIKWKYI